MRTIRLALAVARSRLSNHQRAAADGLVQSHDARYIRDLLVAQPAVVAHARVPVRREFLRLLLFEVVTGVVDRNRRCRALQVP